MLMSGRYYAWSLIVVAVLALVAWFCLGPAAHLPAEISPNDARAVGVLPSAAAEATRHVVASPALDGRHATDAELRVRVVDRSGAAVVGCTVIAWTHLGDALPECATDAGGWARFPGRPAQGGLLAVTAANAWELLHPVALQGEHTVLLDDGASLTGMVLIDGQPGEHGLRIDLRSSSPALPEGTPRQVAACLAALLPARQLTPSPDGKFAVRGLASDWRGTLVAPAGLWFAPKDGVTFEPQFLRISSPGHVVVELVRLPAVRGRARWSDGEPVGSAWVGVEGTLESGMRVGGDAVTAADGQFVVGLGPLDRDAKPAWAKASSRPALAGGSLVCNAAAGSSGPFEVPLTRSALSEPVEVVLPRARRIHFQAVAENGAPLANARIDRPSLPTDAAGRGWFTGSPPKLIGASGYAVVPATANGGDGSETAPLRFVLPIQNRLTVQVTQADQPAGEGLDVCIESEIPLMAGQVAWRELHGDFGGSLARCGTRLRSSESPELHQLHATTDSKGCIDLHSLEPRIEVQIIVSDRAGKELGRAICSTPGFGDRSEIVVRLHERPMRVRGRLLDPSGDPVLDAEVALIGERGVVAMLRTDVAGRFEFWAGKTTTRLDVRMRADGYVKLLRTDVTRGDGDLGAMRFAPGRSITVRVVDESGAPVDLIAQPAGHEEVHQQRVGVGTWRWPEMPAEVEFSATVGGRRFTALAGPGDDEVVVRATRIARAWASRTTLPAELANLPCCIVLHAEQATVPPAVVEFGPNGASGVSVLPGAYLAQLVRRDFRSDGSYELLPLPISQRIELMVGEVTEIRF
jgi:hypothetical protein